MALCFDGQNNRYEYCPTHLSTYIAVGVIVPSAILLIIMLMYIYLRCRQRQIRREHQQTYVATIIPIYNSDQQQQASCNYPYPPLYTSMSGSGFDKPPTYEQTVQGTSETNTNNDNLVENPPVILSVATTTPPPPLEQPTESTRIQFL